MKRRTMQRLFSVLLAAAMLALSAGCSGNNGSSGGGSQAGGGAEDSNFNESGWPVVNETVTLKVYGSRDSNSPEDWNDYILFQDMEEVTNVHFEWELIEGSTYQERKNVMINSGTLPDIIKDGLPVLELARYGQAGLFIDVGDMQQQYCPQLVHFYEINPVLKAAATMPDGKIYSFPYWGGAPWFGIYRMGVVNTDWLEAVDKEIPTTLEELKDVLIAFRDGDPNGNGQKDEIPMSWNGGLYSTNGAWDFGLNFLGDAFQAPGNPDLLDVVDGKVVFVPTREEYKNYVKWMHELYTEGLLDETGFSQTADQYKAKLCADTPIVGVASVWEIGDDFADYSYYDHYEYMDPLKGLNGEDPLPYFTPYPTIGADRWVITNACKMPEVAVRVADYFYDEKLSLEFAEGLFGDEVSEEEQVRQVPCTVCNNGEAYMVGDPPEGVNTQTFRNKCSPASNIPFYYSLETVKKMQHLHYTDKKAVKLEYIATIYDTERIGVLNYTTEESQIISQVQADMITFANRRAAEWVMNGKIDEEWDAYLEELNRMNLDGYLQAVQNAQDRFEEIAG
mgnify:CR=1 FL=1